MMHQACTSCATAFAALVFRLSIPNNIASFKPDNSGSPARECSASSLQTPQHLHTPWQHQHSADKQQIDLHTSYILSCWTAT